MMLHGRPQTYFNSLSVLSLACLLFLGSCVVNYPINKPFVYKTDINVIGDVAAESKAELASRLNSQLDDSIRIRRISKLIYKTLKNPPAYDSINAAKSVRYMHDLMTSLGYFHDSIHYDTSLVVVGDQYRTYVNFDVYTGKVTRIDSLGYQLTDSTLQALSDSTKDERLLSEGAPFAKTAISAEMDRLTTLYRNRGYLKFTRDELMGLWDTIDVSLLSPTLDPFEQLQQLQSLQERKDNPTATLDILLKPNYDSSKLVRYYVGNVVVYPDFSEDTIGHPRKVFPLDSTYTVISYKDMFVPKIFPESIFFRKGNLYNQARYIKTINRFNALGSWRLVNIEPIPRPGTDTVDFDIKLTPAKKYSFNANIEGSRNYNNNLLTTGNFLGLGTNVGVTNHNFFRRAIQTVTNFRYGVELNIGNTDAIQTQQATFNYNVYVPRPLPRMNFFPARYRDEFKTLFGVTVSNTRRKDYFNQTVINGSWGYETQWRNKLLRVKIPNIEYSFLDTLSQLSKLIRDNPSLKSIFTDGLVTSVIANYTVTGGKRNQVNIMRLNVEESGLLTGLIHNRFLDSNLYRFVKLDMELTKTFQLSQTNSVALRFFGGSGIEFKSRNPDHSLYLPFFKSYVAGGPNSMRAWPLRRLGPGSTVRSYDSVPDRFGDVQLETNAEFRFRLFTIAGVDVNSALYTDIGNIWYLRDNPDYPNGSFDFSRLWKDLAVGVGTGVRVDFDFFLIRLDYAFRARDPSPDLSNADAQYKWFYKWGWKTLLNGQLQLGINYPF